MSACRKSEDVAVAAAAPRFIASARVPGRGEDGRPGRAPPPRRCRRRCPRRPRSPPGRRALRGPRATASATVAASSSVGITTEILTLGLCSRSRLRRVFDGTSASDEAHRDEERVPPEPLVRRPDREHGDRDRLREPDDRADAGVPARAAAERRRPASIRKTSQPNSVKWGMTTSPMSRRSGSPTAWCWAWWNEYMSPRGWSRPKSGGSFQVRFESHSTPMKTRRPARASGRAVAVAHAYRRRTAKASRRRARARPNRLRRRTSIS